MNRFTGSTVGVVAQETLSGMQSGEADIGEMLSRAHVGDPGSAMSLLGQAQKLIEAQRKRIAHLENLAMVDEVTGIMNRRGFMGALQREMSHAKRDQSAHGMLLMFDLDDFKKVNDTHGHAAGDAFLTAFGAALASEVRPSDVVARMGGDEFAVLLTRIAPKPGLARAEAVIKKLNSKSMMWREHVLTFSASMGTACFTGRDIAEAVLVSADLKLYVDKQKRKKA
jgi:diguanylate cyclase (GGDEF)-like protein